MYLYCREIIQRVESIEDHMAYLSARLLQGLNSPRELIERRMSIALHVKCIRRMIYLLANDVGGDCATREGFQCTQRDRLPDL